jgi:predicted nucleotidyltransferase
MRTTPATLADSLLGRTRAALLGHVLGHPDEWFHLRQIARESGASAGTAHRELNALVDLGLLLRESIGAAVRFKANTAHPVFPELQSLLAKTGGMPALLRSGIESLGDAVETAFIYGSVARGEQRASSDIDLMVIGDVSLSGLLKALRPVTGALRRDVNPTVYSREEFDRKAREGHSFVERVLAEPKIFLKGGVRESGKPGENRKVASPRGEARRNPKAVARPGAQPRRRKDKGA